MSTLLVLRHGKSDWDADFGTDADRPLATRGRGAAAMMGRYLAATGAPDLAMTSPAVRARDTLRHAMTAGGFDCPVRTVERFYGSGLAAVMEELSGVTGEAEAVLVVGHQPTWSHLVESLTGARVQLPTAALARIELFAGWAGISAGQGELLSLVTPRGLAAIIGDDPGGHP